MSSSSISNSKDNDSYEVSNEPVYYKTDESQKTKDLTCKIALPIILVLAFASSILIGLGVNFSLRKFTHLQLKIINFISITVPFIIFTIEGSILLSIFLVRICNERKKEKYQKKAALYMLSSPMKNTIFLPQDGEIEGEKSDFSSEDSSDD